MGASDFVNLPNIGTSVRRKEDYRFLTGGGQYTDDINIAGQTYAVFVRSPHAHARIKSINIKAAQAAPGVVDVLVGQDVADAKIGGLPCGWLITSTDGQPMKEPPHPILAFGKVRYVGDHVAMVVADTLENAKNAAELVEVDYEPLPAVVDVRDAPKGTALHDVAPDNHCYKWAIGDKGQVDAAFANAAHVTKIDLTNNRLAPNPMEPRAAIGSYNRANGAFDTSGPLDEQGEFRYYPMRAPDLNDAFSIADFAHTGSRELTAHDYVYAFKRLASPRLASPVLGVMAEHIRGFKEFSEELARVDKQEPRPQWLDLRPFTLPGVRALDKHTLRIEVNGKYPQFKYWLAMTFTAPMAWEAERFYSQPRMAQPVLKMLLGRDGRVFVLVHASGRVVQVINLHGSPVQRIVGLLAHGHAPGIGQHAALHLTFFLLQLVHVVDGQQRLPQLPNGLARGLDRALRQPRLQGLNVGGQRTLFLGQLRQGPQSLGLRLLQRRQQALCLGQLLTHDAARAETLVLLRLPRQQLPGPLQRIGLVRHRQGQGLTGRQPRRHALVQAIGNALRHPRTPIALYLGQPRTGCLQLLVQCLHVLAQLVALAHQAIAFVLQFVALALHLLEQRTGPDLALGLFAALGLRRRSGG